MKIFLMMVIKYIAFDAMIFCVWRAHTQVVMGFNWLRGIVSNWLKAAVIFVAKTGAFDDRIIDDAQ